MEWARRSRWRTWVRLESKNDEVWVNVMPCAMRELREETRSSELNTGNWADAIGGAEYESAVRGNETSLGTRTRSRSELYPSVESTRRNAKRLLAGGRTTSSATAPRSA
jgi:hypothetical protein